MILSSVMILMDGKGKNFVQKWSFKMASIYLLVQMIFNIKMVTEFVDLVYGSLNEKDLFFVGIFRYEKIKNGIFDELNV